MVRLQKYLAEAGIASRRAGERLIVEGRVAVNGAVVRELGTRVNPAQDRVTVDGAPIRARRKLYVALHKPPGYLCTRADPKGRPIIGQLLPQEWQHLSSVGRLDADSEGLLFLTNDGQFALGLTHPRYGTKKIYRVTVAGRIEQPAVAAMVRGVSDQGERLRASKATLLSASNKQSVVQLEMTEGKYREVRRLCAALRLEVRRLLRTQIGPIKLGELPPGKWRTLTEPEIKSLLPRYEN